MSIATVLWWLSSLLFKRNFKGKCFGSFFKFYCLIRSCRLLFNFCFFPINKCIQVKVKLWCWSDNYEVWSMWENLTWAHSVSTGKKNLLTFPAATNTFQTKSWKGKKKCQPLKCSYLYCETRKKNAAVLQNRFNNVQHSFAICHLCFCDVERFFKNESCASKASNITVR